MSVEGCGLYSEEDLYATRFSVETNWNGHTIMNEGNSLAHLIQAQPSHTGLIRNRILPMGKVGGSAEGKTDAEGNSSVDAEVHVSAKDEDGGSVTVTAEVSVKRDNEGNVSTSGGVRIEVEREF